MTQGKDDGGLPEENRREIFLALVDAQDHGQGVAASRQLIAERFGLRDDQVRKIEREGLDHQWPPVRARRGEGAAWCRCSWGPWPPCSSCGGSLAE